MAEEWITKGQAAAILGVDERTIERRARAGRIASKGKPGFPTLYRAADVEKLSDTGNQEVRTGVLEAAPAVASNGNGAMTLRPPRPPSYEEAVVELVHTVQRALTQAATGPTGPTIAPTGPTPTALFLTLAEAATVSGLPQADLRRLIDAKELPVRLTGRGGVRIRRRDLEAL